MVMKNKKVLFMLKIEVSAQDNFKSHLPVQKSFEMNRVI